VSSPTRQTRELFIISHTHWDREWYRSFQQYRLQLLSVIDRLLDLMAREPQFRCFLLDGQTAMLEDYLALRPERAGKVRDLVSAGRLQLGPWYVQPDEFMVSGEALIRNLLLGEQTAEARGGVTRVGWLPDTFGHVAQLPQILRNFGIESFIFSRGLGEPMPANPSAFWWEAPDGSRVLALHQVGGYWNAGNLGYPCFWGDTARRALDLERALETVRRLVPELDPDGALPALAIWNGADHTPPQSDLPQTIAYLDAHLDGLHVRHGSIQDYVTALLSGAPSLSTLQGELRGSRCQCMPTSTFSSRAYLKQANHRAQRLLERYAEPLSAVATVLGDGYPAAELREAWRLLLLNHAHDGICGCSTDPVHREMVSRFEQVEQIAQALVERGCDALADRVDTAWCAPGQAPVLILNPHAHPRLEVVQTTLRLPERPEALRVIGSEGDAGAAQILATEREQYDWIPRLEPAGQVGLHLPLWREYLRDLHGLDIGRHEWQQAGGQVSLKLLLGDRHLSSGRAEEQLLAEIRRLPPDTQVRLEATCQAISLVFRAGVPALGYATCTVEACDVPPDPAPSLARGTRAMENEHLRVEVEQDGALTILHKATGREYRGLHRFEDAADAGDTYDFCPLPGRDGSTLLSPAPEVALIEDGPLQASLRVHWEFTIPETLTDDRQDRSPRRTALPVTSILRLRAGSPYVEITTTVHNRATDHRLRVHFPTHISGQFIHADGHFAVVSRSVQMPSGSGWEQPPSGLQHHHTWFAADDDSDGLAILSEGLYEHEALNDEGGLTLALTLLRGVGWLSRGDLSTRRGHAGPAIPTPEAQCLGVHAFRYGILPYPGGAARAHLPQMAAAFSAPLLACPLAVQQGALPPQRSFVSLEPEELVLSALKRSEAGDGLIVRCYNAGNSSLQARARFGFALAGVWQATAGEKAIRQVDLDSTGTGCEFEAGPGQIVTLLLRPA